MTRLVIDDKRIGTSSPNFSLIDFREMYLRVQKDFAIWEIVTEGEHHRDRIQGLVQELQASYPIRLQTHVPIGDVNIGSISERMRNAAVEEVVGALRFASEIDAEPVTIHPGYFSPVTRGNESILIRQMELSLKVIDKAADNFGVLVCLENMPNFPFAFCKTPKELLSAMEGTGFSITLDIGHANTNSNIVPFLYPEITDLVENVHLHDNFGKMDDHTALGDGTIDIPRVVSELEGLGYRGNYIIETKNYDSSKRGREYMQRIGELFAC